MVGNINKICLCYVMIIIFIFDNDFIIYVSLGDFSGFEFIYFINDYYDLFNMLVIKFLFIGVDINLIVVGVSGIIYIFYLFSIIYISKF